MYLNLLKISIPTALAFFFGIILAPLATHFFFKYKMWKKHARTDAVSSSDFSKIHNGEEELHTPRVGGIIIWLPVLLVVLIFYVISVIFPTGGTVKMNFLSRNQTLIPVFTLLFASLIGLWDDLIQIYGTGKFARDDKSWRMWKSLLVGVMSLLIGLWFFFKLGMTGVHIPFVQTEFYLGILIIPFFIIVALATFSGGVIDGIDGLSGGVLSSIFAAYSIIAYAHNQIDIAAFCGVITGATLAFLWFNIPPARFYMGETGMMGLTITLATIAFLTDTVLILPIIALTLVITSGSVILQLFYKRYMGGKKLFKVAPLHHHFEVIGWSRSKITMRYWILSIVFAIIGVILAVIS